MKASELILHLSDLIDLHGDLEVYTYQSITQREHFIRNIEREDKMLNPYGEFIEYPRIVIK